MPRTTTFTSAGIIGVGNVGLGLAADRYNRGQQAVLYAHPAHRTVSAQLAASGKLEAIGKIEGTFACTVTEDIEVLLKNFLIFITVPSNGHNDIISLLRGHDLAKHTLVVMPGNCFGDLAREEGINAKTIVETNSSPYSSRVVDGPKVHVRGLKETLEIGAAAPIGRVFRQAIEESFSVPLTWRLNELEIVMRQPNGTVHPAATLMNLGRVESTGGDFYFYRDGMTPSVCRVIEAVDNERIKVAVAFGLERPKTILELGNEMYGSTYGSFNEFAEKSEAHNASKKAPNSVGHRTIAEDVPDLLVIWYELGLLAGVETPAIRALITLASIASDKDFMQTGRTLEKLGLGNLTKEEMSAKFTANNNV